MQTHLPFPDFSLTAACLDNERLGKQRVEALAIYKILREGREENNPAIKMWRGYQGALAWYHNTMLSVWKHRGFVTNAKMLTLGFPVIFPPWIGNKELHRSHQSNLLRKDETHYRLWFGTTVPKNLDLYWPVR